MGGGFEKKKVFTQNNFKEIFLSKIWMKTKVQGFKNDILKIKKKHNVQKHDQEITWSTW